MKVILPVAKCEPALNLLFYYSEPPTKKHKSTNAAGSTGGIRSDWQRPQPPTTATGPGLLANGDEESMVRDGAGFGSDDDENGEAFQVQVAKASLKVAGAPRTSTKKTPAHQMV